MYQEIVGDLIALAKAGKFDVIAHGCNCFCNMRAGIAIPMSKNFGCDRFPLELREYRHIDEYDNQTFIQTSNEGDINKLGQIDYQQYYINTKTGRLLIGSTVPLPEFVKPLTVVNAYTQYRTGVALKPLDYEALTLCMRKMNHLFQGMHIGLPLIGAGLAGGDWERIKVIIQEELSDCNVTIVHYDKK